MNNLPTDKNQTKDNNQNVVNDNSPVTSSEETPPVKTAAAKTMPEEKVKITLPPSPSLEEQSKTGEQSTPTEEKKEKTIEIGSLEEPSFTTYKQDTPTTAGGNSNNKKGKKLKTVASVLGILLIIVSLPLTVLLVKQRQEIRKEAAGTQLSNSISFCGITITPISHSEKNGVYTFNYSITGSGHTVEVHEYGCACPEGNRDTCGTSSGTCSTNSYTQTTPINRTINVRQPAGDCGTFQADVFVLSVDGRRECHNN
jgi:hypothetical protein